MRETEVIADPEGAYYFALEIEGCEIAQFMECSGLKSTTEIFEVQEGGLNDRVHKFPGQSKWENITLRWGVTSNVDMLNWRAAVLQDKFHEDEFWRNGSIVLKGQDGAEVRRYNFKMGWPVSWEGPSFNGGSSDIAIEALELAHHGIDVVGA